MNLRKTVVPIDMSSEQKTILGMISKRQLIYLVVTSLLLNAIVPPIFNLPGNPIVGLILVAIVALPIVVTSLILAFYKNTKHHMYLDYYLLVKLGYKTQIGVWRKGPELNGRGNERV
jgi:hypothetical protein